MEQEIDKLKKRCKKTEEKYSSLLKTINKKQEELNPEMPTWATMSPSPATNDYYNITTSNRFQTLDNKVDPEQNMEQMNLNPQKLNPLQSENETESQDDAGKSTKPKTRKHKQNSNYPDHTQKSINAETIIICDSNGHYLQEKTLCPNSTTKYIQCPTISKASEIMENTKFTNPKTLYYTVALMTLNTQNLKETSLQKLKKLLTKPRKNILIVKLLSHPYYREKMI